MSDKATKILLIKDYSFKEQVGGAVESQGNSLRLLFLERRGLS